jgi:succinate dehydrogenase / fumarate reductase, cytochrome b subunit
MSKYKPLSPHLQIYRPQITSVLSILHRATGAFLSLGFIVFVLWLFFLLDSAYPKSQIAELYAGSFIRLVFVAWCFSFFYHLGNGIRHLAWDTGYGFEINQIRNTGLAVVAFAIISTLIFVYLIF